MKYQSEIIVPLTLSRNVVSNEFKRKILASLDCAVCNRSGRTVVMYEDQERTFCTPRKHPFPGRIVAIEVSGKEDSGSVSGRFVVSATYRIEYDFEEFMDQKNPSREIQRGPTWSRAAFMVTCKCGEQIEEETQNNMVQPRKAVCACGRDLFYEEEEIPLFRNTTKA